MTRCRDETAKMAVMSHEPLRSGLVKSVVSSFSLRQKKHTTELPL